MRLDNYLFEKGFYPSRTKAAEACERGEVTVDGKTALKPSYQVGEGLKIETTGVNYVSVGAFKMIKAISAFSLDCRGKVFVDIGASTGGFTQSLLLSGARRVYCVDVGEDLLDKSLQNDGRVVVMDKTNARYLKKDNFPERPDGVVVDCSFISLRLLLPTLKGLIDENGIIIALIKPQFECGRKALSKSGLVSDKRVRADTVFSLCGFIIDEGLTVKDFTYAPVYEKKNVEYLVLLDRSGENVDRSYIEKSIAEADGIGR